nr:hypothetical protein [Cohnella cholangitidis]
MGNLSQLPAISDPDLRWAALLTGMALSEKDCAELFRTLRISGRRSTRIAGIVGMSEQLNEYDDHSFREGWTLAVLQRGRTLSEDWIEMNEACGNGSAADCMDWLEQLPVTSISDLNVRGDEMTRALGRRPGPWITEMLQRLLEAVAFGIVPNDKSALLSVAAKESAESREEER